MAYSGINRHILAGDFGGTKTSLALYSPGQDLQSPAAEATYRNSSFNSATELLSTFLQETGNRPDYACFGVAGPVAANRVQMTNYGWFLDGEQLKRDLGIGRVFLINDLVATAMGAVKLPESCLDAPETASCENRLLCRLCATSHYAPPPRQPHSCVGSLV